MEEVLHNITEQMCSPAGQVGLAEALANAGSKLEVSRTAKVVALMTAALAANNKQVVDLLHAPVQSMQGAVQGAVDRLDRFEQFMARAEPFLVNGPEKLAVVQNHISRFGGKIEKLRDLIDDLRDEFVNPG